MANRLAYNIRAEAESRHAEIKIYAPIGGPEWWPYAVDSKSFTDELDELDVDTILVRINSPGGEVFDGYAIHTALREHPAHVTVRGEGLVASIATVIALAADKVEMAKGSHFMIHNPATFEWGEASDLRKTADLLDKIRDTIVGTYHDKTGMAVADLVEAMDDETWYSAEEAVEAGFADAVSGEEADVAATAQYDHKVLADMKFRHAPAALVAALATRKPSAKRDANVVADDGDTMHDNSDPTREQQIRDLQTRYPIH